MRLMQYLGLVRYLSLLMALGLLHGSCRSGVDENGGFFRYNESSGITTLDPAFAKSQALMWPVRQLFNTLVAVDAQMNLVPSLARGWQFSEDRKTITFQLRRDVYFHEDSCFGQHKTRRLIASDVAYSLHRLSDPETGSPGAWIFNGLLADSLPFHAPNDSVFVLRLNKPYVPVIGLLSMPYCSVVAPEAVKAYGKDLGRHPVGTGPFRLVAWEPGQSLLLHKHPRYFETDSTGQRLPYLNGIHISLLGSKTTEFLLFRQGKLDMISDLDPALKDEVLTRKGQLQSEWKKRIRMEQVPFLNTEYLGFLLQDTESGPLKDPRVRRAIGYAINRDELIFQLRNSIGEPARSGFAPQGLPSFDAQQVEGYRYDLSLSDSLLRAAGYGPAHPVPPFTLVTTPSNALMGSYLAAQLDKAGFHVQVEIEQKSLLLDRMSQTGVPCFRGSWIADIPDAINFFSVFYGPNPAPPNYTRFQDSTFDRLYEKSLQTPADSQRYTMYRDMERIILEKAPLIPLWYDRVLWFMGGQIQGLHPDAMNQLDLRHVTKR